MRNALSNYYDIQYNTEADSSSDESYNPEFDDSIEEDFDKDDKLLAD